MLQVLQHQQQRLPGRQTLQQRGDRLQRAMVLKPVLEVGPTRYQAGRFGSGFKPRPKSDAGIRPVPLAPLVVEAIRRQLPPGSDPDDLGCPIPEM